MSNNDLEDRYPAEIQKICKNMHIMSLLYSVTPFPEVLHEKLKAEVKMLFSKIEMAEALR